MNHNSAVAGSPAVSLNKEMDGEHIEAVRTASRVPGNDQDEEKNGIRTDGDGEDHDHEPPMSFSRMMSLVAMAFLWTGSQIPLYLFDLGGVDRWVWFVLANLLALAAVCPFVGALSDLLGRRWVAISGGGFLVIGMIVCSTAHTMNTFIAGMALAGVGAGINELTALAATAELAPTAKRGKYVAALIFTIVPFCPSVLWAQLMAYHASWRYIGLLCGVWAAIGTIMTTIFYFPPPRVNSTGLGRQEVIAQIDLVGGFLSIAGMILFIAGLLWGGYQYPWTSVHVLVPLLLGAGFLVGFGVWEVYGAPYPMFPSRLRKAPRILALTLVITFISGANFFSVLLFWPTQAFNVYGHDPIGVGLRGMPIGFSILAGACIVLFVPALKFNIASACVQHNIFDGETIKAAAELTGASLITQILTLPGVDGNVTIWTDIVLAGQASYAHAYPYVYYASIAFGAVAIMAAVFLGDIAPYMDDHVAVVMH
ncbi:hypothetical protein BUE80_DR005355 [Diplocarpon rosae]|nr:hypothetical protein BUE80_DR005355 [Diplocarpon rosae]